MDSTDKKKPSGSSSSLAPGFRFHPTDEELVRYYLRRKVCGKTFRFDAISEIDIYKNEPWDLPSFSKLKTRDLEWYFFSVLDKKYGNGSRTNRATEKGYWKTTGKDRTVYHRSQIVGMKKTLVYHNGRAPKGLRTNWVMHEYRLTDLELERTGVSQDAFVLCRVFQKSGSGPKNGEQYGAPFVEEEWEEDELEMVPKAEAAEEVDFGDDAYLDGQDLEQILGSDTPPVPLTVQSGDASYLHAPIPLNAQSGDCSYGEQTVESVDSQKLLASADEHYCESEQCHENNLYVLPTPNYMDANPVKHEYIGESSKSGSSDDLEYLLDEPFMDAPDELLGGQGGFIEANDLSNPIDANNSSLDMLDEYLTFFDSSDDPSQYFAFDPSQMLGSEDNISYEALLPHKEFNDGADEASLLSDQDIKNNNTDAASPSKMKVPTKIQSDYQYPFIEHASQMLGNIPAPPAFAAEFPSKEAAVRLNSLSQSSSSVHVTAGMIQIRNMTMTNDGRDRASSKHGNFNIVLSFGFSQGDDGSASLESSVHILPGKTVSALSSGWFYFMLFWVFLISISFKFGSCISAK